MEDNAGFESLTARRPRKVLVRLDLVIAGVRSWG